MYVYSEHQSTYIEKYVAKNKGIFMNIDLKQ